MDPDNLKNIDNFFIAGINYKKSDASVRGQFAINTEQYHSLLEKAANKGLHELFILSTCNRTEVYGFATAAHQLIDLLCSETAGGADVFKKAAYIKKGTKAVEHLFCVGAGLDSQILGDYEIVGQLKTAVKIAKERGFVGVFTERLINAVLQSSKLIKNTTGLSGGTVSVSFAAIQYIRNKVLLPSSKNILLLGVGKIGRNTCKNLIDYLNAKNITLINRTEDKAIALAAEVGVKSTSVNNLSTEIKKADIILVATNAARPTVLKEHLEGGADKLVIDLSVPCNVEEEAQTLSNIHLVNVDQLSKLKDETLKVRKGEVPKARAIIDAAVAEFKEWHEMRRHVPVLKAVKLKLREIHTHPLFMMTAGCTEQRDVEIQRAINDMAFKMRQQNKRGCQYIEAINHYIKAGAKN